MTLQEAFYLQVKQEKLFTRNDHVLVAVSTGVDSMVLLDLLQRLPSKVHPEIGVVHFNHGLREQSLEEEQFLKEYCLDKQLPFYSETWEVPSDIQVISEATLREARYAFFDRICRQHGYTHLVTAHHGTDQVETVLRRLVTGSYIWDMSGISMSQQRATYLLVRPLLFASKADLLHYACTHGLDYYEDATNSSREYQRNRIRHDWLPLIEKENPNYLQHFHHFVTQLNYTKDIVSQVVDPMYSELVTYDLDERPQLNRAGFLRQPESLQYMVFTKWLEDTVISKGININHRQVQAVLQMIRSEAPQKAYPLEEGWQIMTTYTVIQLVHQKAKTTENSRVNEDCASYEMTLGDVLKVEPGVQFSLVETKSATLNEKNSLTVLKSDLPLTIRRPLPGDAFIMNQQGNKKKISRYFIDNKWPKEKRDNAWVVVNRHGEVLWIPPFRKSYLSIVPETDKIQYKLLYNKADNSGGETEC